MTEAPPITFTDRELSVRFAAPWTLPAYDLFLRTKRLPESAIAFDAAADAYTLTAPARFAPLLGVATPRPRRRSLAYAEFLFDYQLWIVQMAVEARRFCIWADCGLGKTPMLLEFARQAHSREGGRVLIFSPANVVPQIIRETAKFYPDGALPIQRIESREDMIAWAASKPIKGQPWLGITNYEKLIPQKESPQQVVNELRHLTAVICDESSILKTKGGTIKWALMKSTYGVPFKLSCTATPAPNDALEYLSQAGFLDKFNDNTGQGAALASFFKLEADGVCTLKPHAREAFFRFMTSWSIYLRKPSAYGFKDPFADVQEPAIEEIKVPATPEQDEAAMSYLRARNPGNWLIPKAKFGVTERSKLSQIAKGFVYEGEGGARLIPSNKPKVVANLVRRGLDQGKQVLVWTVFDVESELVHAELRATPGVEVLHGKTTQKAREAVLDRFAGGECRALISKAQLLGYGLNFPFCTWMVFSGFDDSFERFYQAVRRCYRYGSREQLSVFIPYVPTLEDYIWENVLRKKSSWEADVAEQETNYVAALAAQKGQKS